MKQKIMPGGEIDAITAEEIRDIFSEAVSGVGGAPENVIARANGKTSAAGLLDLEVYIVPPGQEFVLCRAIVSADGFTAAVPFTGAGSFLEIRRNDEMVDFKSLVAAAAVPAGLPAKFGDSETQAPIFRQGDRVIIHIEAGPASTNVVASIKGIGFGQKVKKN